MRACVRGSLRTSVCTCVLPCASVLACAHSYAYVRNVRPCAHGCLRLCAFGCAHRACLCAFVRWSVRPCVGGRVCAAVRGRRCVRRDLCGRVRGRGCLRGRVRMVGGASLWAGAGSCAGASADACAGAGACACACAGACAGACAWARAGARGHERERVGGRVRGCVRARFAHARACTGACD